MAIIVATTAENRPVYVSFQSVRTTVMGETLGHTNRMIPSASFCHRSAILVSSSSEIFEYMAKRGHELSTKLGSLCGGLPSKTIVRYFTWRKLETKPWQTDL